MKSLQAYHIQYKEMKPHLDMKHLPYLELTEVSIPTSLGKVYLENILIYPTDINRFTLVLKNTSLNKINSVKVDFNPDHSLIFQIDKVTLLAKLNARGDIQFIRSEVENIDIEYTNLVDGKSITQSQFLHSAYMTFSYSDIVSNILTRYSFQSPYGFSLDNYKKPENKSEPIIFFEYNRKEKKNISIQSNVLKKCIEVLKRIYNFNEYEEQSLLRSTQFVDYLEISQLEKSMLEFD